MNLVIAAAQSSSVPGNTGLNVAHHLRFAIAAAEQGVQLLVFPELSLTGYELTLARSRALTLDAPELNPLRSFAARARMTLIAGGPLLNDAGQLHIAAFVFHPDGSVSTYKKMHVHESELGVFTPGSGGSALKISEANVALAICADVSHPQHAANAAREGANVYAAGVMIDEIGYARKIPLLRNYAVEHGLAVLMANYSGITGGEVSAGKSAIWSEDGQPVASSTGNDETLVIAAKQNGDWTGSVLPM